jgi:hypothetical protein
MVKVCEGSSVYRFMIFFKRHCKLRKNKTLQTQCFFQGDIVAMRIAAKNDSPVVNMRGRDTILLDWVIPK